MSFTRKQLEQAQRKREQKHAHSGTTGEKQFSRKTQSNISKLFCRYQVLKERGKIPAVVNGEVKPEENKKSLCLDVRDLNHGSWGGGMGVSLSEA